MSSPRLLLIEDNPDDIALARRAMERNKVTAALDVAQSATEAFALLTPVELPRVVFLDLNMPGANGHEILARLRKDPRTRALPVVILTTSREPADITRSYHLGANSYVTKPIDFREFTELFVTLTSYWVKVNETVR
jgi:two-component system response regulator